MELRRRKAEATAASKCSRVSAGILSDPTPLNNLWIEQVAWGSSKSIGDTSSYDISGWASPAATTCRSAPSAASA